MLRKVGFAALSLVVLVIWTVVIGYQLGGAKFLLTKLQKLPVPVRLTPALQKSNFDKVVADNTWQPTFRDVQLITLDRLAFQVVNMQWSQVQANWQQDPRSSSSPSAWFFGDYFYSNWQNRVLYIDPETVGKQTLVTEVSTLSATPLTLSWKSSQKMSYRQLISDLPKEIGTMFAIVEAPLSLQTDAGYYLVNFFDLK